MVFKRMMSDERVMCDVSDDEFEIEEFASFHFETRNLLFPID